MSDKSANGTDCWGRYRWGRQVSPRTTESKGVLKGMCRMLSVDGVCTLQGRGELHPLPYVNGVVSTLK